jgi:hypothetical protein
MDKVQKPSVNDYLFLLHPWNASFHLSFLISDSRLRLLRRVTSPVARPLPTHKHRINADKHPCLEWDSNPRCQCPSERTNEDFSCLRPRGHCERQQTYRAWDNRKLWSMSENVISFFWYRSTDPSWSCCVIQLFPGYSRVTIFFCIHFIFVLFFPLPLQMEGVLWIMPVPTKWKIRDDTCHKHFLSTDDR